MVYRDSDQVQHLLDEVTEKGVSVGYLGSGQEKQKVDIMLTPSSERWDHQKVEGHHARIYIHRTTQHVVLEARHALSIQIRGVAAPEKIFQSDFRILNPGDLIKIGALSYVFGYGHEGTRSSSAMYSWQPDLENQF